LILLRLLLLLPLLVQQHAKQVGLQVVVLGSALLHKMHAAALRPILYVRCTQ
jgi:hypothetical protein